MKPAEPGAEQAGLPESAEELAHLVRAADDKERLIGLVAAPLAAAVAFLVNAVVIAHDPAAQLADGQPNKLHVAFSVYYELLGAMLVLSLLALVLAWFRKRLYLGVVLALYGLSLFNLHYWGFALPFLMVGSWLLVRSYRLQRALREATASAPGGRPAVVRASKRYTPPASAARSRPAGQHRAG